MMVDKFLSAAARILIGLLFLTAVGLIVLRLQGMRVLTVQTSSMQPALQPSDVVIISTKKPANLQAGTIVSFASSVMEGQLVTHRLVSVDKQRDIVIARGDNLETADWPMRSRQIIGVVHWHVPGAGRWLNWLRRPAGQIIGIYIPALTIIASEVHRLYRPKRRRIYSIYNSI